MTANTAGAIASRTFAILRKGAAGWQIDAAGFWSYPSLSVDPNGKLLWIYTILQAVPMPEKKRTALFRPKAIVVTRAGTTDLVCYENLRTGHDPFPTLAWDKPVAMFPHRSVAGLSYSDFEAKEAELLREYPAAGDQFLKNRKLPAALVKQYLDLIHPVFLPYVRHLALQFFDALGVEKNRMDRPAN